MVHMWKNLRRRSTDVSDEGEQDCNSVATIRYGHTTQIQIVSICVSFALVMAGGDHIEHQESQLVAVTELSTPCLDTAHLLFASEIVAFEVKPDF